MSNEDPPPTRRGKAPPVDSFSGEDVTVRLDDWVPALKRAAAWNHWSVDDQLLQLAGHLHGRALQEWDLIPDADKAQLESAIGALRERLELGGRMLAVQDFRHASQREDEPVSDFVSRLERSFRVAYGRDVLSTETRHTLLHSQLQEGLRYELMKVSSVSGAQTYQALVMATKNEERRIEELRKRQQYQKAGSTQPQATSPNPGIQPSLVSVGSHLQERELRGSSPGPFDAITVEGMVTSLASAGSPKAKARAGPLGGHLPEPLPSRFESRLTLQPHQPPHVGHVHFALVRLQHLTKFKFAFALVSFCR